MKAKHRLRLKNLHIDAGKEAILYLRRDSLSASSDNFAVSLPVTVTVNNKSIVAKLHSINNQILSNDEACLSEWAWHFLGAKEGDDIELSRLQYIASEEIIRKKIDGVELNQDEMTKVISDLVSGNLSDIHIAAFLTACANDRLSHNEMYHLTKAMIESGDRIKWPSDFVVDKHCVGGLPGNRTSIIVVPIVAAFGLTIPKTSSRAITSPSGTADTMEVLAPVNLSISMMRKVVEQENGCVVWGDSVNLSPADDMFIRVENVLNLDSKGQLIASILSKKIAAGSTHIIIDIPVGPTAKIATIQEAEKLKYDLELTASRFGIVLKAVISSGIQPVGRGIGPALEAKDVLAVLRCASDAPQDLRDHALTLAGHLLEFSPHISPGTGKDVATSILDSGRAFEKFKAICDAQGGMREPGTAPFQHVVLSEISGIVTAINNQHMATVAKLAGAPSAKTAGIEILVSIGMDVAIQQPLYVIHSEKKSDLTNALNYSHQVEDIIQLQEHIK